MQKRHDMGSGGMCFCPKCGYKEAHQQGMPCQKKRCPECNVKMIREGSYHHDLINKKQTRKGE